MIWWVFLLFLVGTLLVLAEFIVPGGICGTIGALFLVASCGLGWRAFPEYGVFIIIGEFVGALACVAAGMVIVSKTGAAKGLVLADSQQAQAGWVASDSNELLIGMAGEVYTALRPAGTIIVDGKRIDAVSDGEFVERGAAIKVIEVHGSRVVVERATTE